MASEAPMAAKEPSPTSTTGVVNGDSSDKKAHLMTTEEGELVEVSEELERNFSPLAALGMAFAMLNVRIQQKL